MKTTMLRLLCSLCLALCFTASLHAENAPKFVELKGHTDEIWSIAFSPDGKNIVTASKDGTVRIWDAESGEEINKWTTFPLGVTSAYFSPDENTILTANEVGVVIRDAETGKVLRNLRGHTGIINTAVFSPDGTKIVTASYDKTARIWDTETGKELHKLEGHTGFVMSAAFSPDGKKVITAGSGERSMTIVGLLSRERTFVAKDDKTYRIWDVETGKELKKSEEHLNGIDSVAFSPDEKRIITTGVTFGADIWDTVTGEQLNQLNQNVANVYFTIESACFSPDGKKIVTTAHTLRHAQIWDAESGEKLQTLAGHTDRISSAVFSPDSKKIATASWDNTARIWTLE